MSDRFYKLLTVIILSFAFAVSCSKPAETPVKAAEAQPDAATGANPAAPEPVAAPLPDRPKAAEPAKKAVEVKKATPKDEVKVASNDVKPAPVSAPAPAAVDNPTPAPAPVAVAP